MYADQTTGRTPWDTQTQETAWNPRITGINIMVCAAVDKVAFIYYPKPPPAASFSPPNPLKHPGRCVPSEAGRGSSRHQHAVAVLQGSGQTGHIYTSAGALNAHGCLPHTQGSQPPTHRGCSLTPTGPPSVRTLR